MFLQLKFFFFFYLDHKRWLESWMDTMAIKQIRKRWQIPAGINKRRLQLTKGHAQHQGCDQQDGAGGQNRCTIAVVLPLAVALVGSITVVAEATLHLCSRAAAVRLVAESLVRARLYHSVWKRARQPEMHEASRHSQINCFEVIDN